jgi:hypothetical protein
MVLPTNKKTTKQKQQKSRLLYCYASESSLFKIIPTWGRSPCGIATAGVPQRPNSNMSGAATFTYTPKNEMNTGEVQTKKLYYTAQAWHEKNWG